MEGELNLENILGADEIDNLFEDNETQETSPETKEEKSEKNSQEETKQLETTEVDVNNLFTDNPESVGSEENNQELGENPGSNEVKDSSSKDNFYSSIAKALKDDGILPDLDDNIASNIKAPEDFAEAIEQQIKAQLNERQRRIDEALNVGIEPSEIKKFENVLTYLDSLQEDALLDESDKGENLRKQLIYQDFINRGYSKERAQREVTKSFNANTDLDDAKEALSSNKEYFQSEYDTLINEAKEEEKRENQERKEQADKLKKSILEDTKVFGELSIDKSTRQKVFDTISKPVYKDSESGEYYTALQKYEKENKTEFLKNVGLLFTLTNGFKNLDGLIKGKVKKELNSSLRELEHTLSNTSRTSNGSLKFVTGVEEDPESFIGKGYSLDF